MQRDIALLSLLKGLVVLLLILLYSQPAHATHIPIGTVPVLGQRTPLPNEGYLSFLPDPGSGRFGDEWTGWIDVRHPSLAGPRSNTSFGYARSDHFVQVQTTILQDNMDPPMVARSDRVTDFEFANKAYISQGGLSVIETRNQQINSPAVRMPNSFRFPTTFNPDEINIMRNLNRNRAEPLVDVYYSGALATGNLGETFFPSFPRGIAAVLPDGIFMANFNRIRLPNMNVIQGPLPDVFAHELFHFLGDGDAVHLPIAGDPAHSSDSRNLISAGPVHFSPGMNTGALAPLSPPWNIPNGTEVIGPRLSTTNGQPGGPPLVGGVDQLTSAQIQRIFAAPNVAPYLPANQRGDVDAAGDLVDWDFVVDHRSFLHDNDANPATPDVRFGLEGLTNQADNHPGADPLFWGLASTEAPNHPAPTADNLGHDHRGLATFPATPDYLDSGNKFFRTVDVFSLDAQFAESDILPGSGLRSTSESVLDYDLSFLGVNDAIVPGILQTVFIDGWAQQQHADDYLARWVSPIPAVGVLIRAHDFGEDGHDGNAQINAIIASSIDIRTVPEPTTLALVSLGVVALGLAARGGWIKRS